MKLNRGVLIAYIAAIVVGVLLVIAAFIVNPIIGGILGSIEFVALFLTYRTHIKPSVEYSALLKNGIKATATILSIAETGIWINNAPVLKIKLMVKVPEKKEYTTVMETAISYFDATKYRTGTQIPILVDRNNLNKIQLVQNAG